MLLRPPRIRPIRQETPTTEPDRPFGRLSEPGAPESISSWGRWRVRGTGLWRPGGGRGHMIFKRGPVFDSAGCDGDRRRSEERRVGKEGRSRWAPDESEKRGEKRERTA